MTENILVRKGTPSLEQEQGAKGFLMEWMEM
jgi:hypothetical protein